MSKVLFLGIDALDRELLERFEPELPNLSALHRRAVSLPVRSTFPPDSDTAWATIFTGMNPAEHGIVRFVDPLEKSYQILNVGSRNEVLHGRTFWEVAARAGRKTVAVFPHLCYPVWPTGGAMVARGASVAGAGASDPALLERYPDAALLSGVRGFPDRRPAGMRAYHDRLTRLALADAEFALRLMRENEWDLFFVYWSTIDATGHFFWSHFDPEDPNYRPGNPLERVIPDTYALYDQIVGRFLAEIDDDTTLIVLSDHGHGGRPFKLVSVNDVLRRGGYLTAKDARTNPHVGLFEASKRAAVGIVSRYGLAKPAGRLLRRFPGAIQAFTRPAAIDWQRTVAYASDMSGIKAYPYGGVSINREALGARDYEETRRAIIALLERECRGADGEPLLAFIARREDVYRGPYLANYPDIVLEFREGYGVGWAVDAPLITHAAAHNLVPGSHRGATGTFLMRGSDPLLAAEIDLRDVAALVLRQLGIAGEEPAETSRAELAVAR